MIQVGDVLSGRTLNFSFPNGMTFAESGTVFSSDNYSVEMVYDETTDDNDVTTITMTVVLNDSDSTLIETFYSANTVSGTTTTTVNLTTYTLPTSFGVCSSIDDTVVAYQYIVAVMGTPLCSDTLNMASYQTTHDEAAKTATNYLHYDVTNGLVISEDAATDPTLLSGGNVRITSDGMKLYNGQTQVANLGTTVELGRENGARLYLDSDTLSATSIEGFSFFSVDIDGTPVPTWYRSETTIDVSSYVGQTHTETIALEFGTYATPDGETISVDFFIVGIADSNLITLTKGTVLSGSGTSASGDYNYSYDGDYTLTITCYVDELDEAWFFDMSAYYTGNSPSYTLGTRNSDTRGAFSVTLGQGLSAESNNQTVIGKYNDEDSSKAFIIGTGDENTNANGLTVDWNGNLVCNSMDCGQITGIYAPAGDTTTAEWVDFNHEFSSAPIVVGSFCSNVSASPLNDFGRCNLSIYGITTTGFYFRVFNNGTIDRSPSINWIAMLT